MKMLLFTLLAGVALTFGNPFSREDAEKLRDEMLSMKEKLTGIKDVINVNGIVNKAEIISKEMKANDIKSLEDLASLGDQLEVSLKDMETHDVKFNAKEVKEQMDEIMQNVRSKVQPKPAEDEKTLMSLISSAKKVVADTTNDLASKIASVKELESIADSFSSKLKDLKAKKSQIDFKFFKEELTKVKKDAEQKLGMSPVKDPNKPETKAKDENYLSSLITSAKETIAGATDDMESKIKAVKKLKSIVSDFSTTLINLKAEKADLDVQSFKDEIEIVKKDAEAIFGEKKEDAAKKAARKAKKPKKAKKPAAKTANPDEKFGRKPKPKKDENKPSKKDFSYLHLLMKDAKQAVSDASNDVDSKKKALEKVDWLTSEFADALKDLKDDDVKTDIDQFKEEVLGLQEDLKNKFLDKEEHDEVKTADVYNNLVDMTEEAKKVVSDFGSDPASKLDALNQLKSLKEEFKVTVKDAMNQHMDINYKALLGKLKDVEKSIKPLVDSMKTKKDETIKAKNEVNEYLSGLAKDAKEIVADVVSDNTHINAESLNKLKSLETEFKDVINDASKKHIDVEYNKLYDQLKDVEKDVDSIIHAKDEKKISVEKKKDDTASTEEVEKVSDNQSLLDLTGQINTIVAGIGRGKASQEDALHQLEALKPVFKQIVKDVKKKNIDVEYNRLEAQLKDAEMAVIAKKDEFAPRRIQPAPNAPAAPQVEADAPAAPVASQPEAFAPHPKADVPAAPIDAPQPEADVPDVSQPKADSPKAQNTIDELKTLEEQLESAFDV